VALFRLKAKKEKEPVSHSHCQTQMNGKKILVIDDNQDINDMFALAFELAGFSVQQSFSGKDGIKIYKEFHPNVILLDIVMPAMDGNEVLSRIKKETPEPPLVIIFSNMEWEGETSEKVRSIKKSSVTPTQMVELVMRWM